MLLAMLLLAGVGAAADPVLAACGDDVVDPGEDCDHGAANGADNCCSTSCRLVDRDWDGICDAIDPCDGNAGGVSIKDSRLAISRLSTPPGDDVLRFTGTITVWNDPPIDPSVSGVRLLMFTPPFDPHGVPVAEVVVPAGAQWRQGRSGTWRYRGAADEASGITRVDVRLSAPLYPSPHLTKVTFRVAGRRGSFPVTPDMVTSFIPPGGLPQGSALQVTFALAPPGTSTSRQCGDVYYTTLRPTNCRFNVSEDQVACSGPPPVGPCHLGDANDLVLCDLLNAADAETRYFADHATYLSGPCSILPGFVGSPGVTCTAYTSGTQAWVSTSNPSATYLGCTWSSDPGANPAIVCS